MSLKTTLLLMGTLALTLCCTRATKWQSTTISTGFAEHDSSRLTFPATSFLHDMELEFIYSNNELTAFINVFSKLIPAYDGDENSALLTIKTPDGSYQILCHRYGGGQKLKIPQDSIELVVSLLERYLILTMSLSSFYQLKVYSLGFQRNFKRLKKKTLPLTSNKPIGIAF